ncbi:hypothetical protein AMAG_11742 [Allomyces macrogynus ATCC 38327]|uniref:Uncharacterized protein n=1 Tax=Allomyces macrogynus (strain ATCC 38327) TaxID=578462 RepID=A0A0L0SWA9_ALLM3|nr:hypothetical protein AMAG_11742 [Allomyces macrogynus ATCC 38327]|eukprot:KNE66624.1 hypothetical protein AMAG_11742 [Allomyces macrogynus ATCC 38327]
MGALFTVRRHPPVLHTLLLAADTALHATVLSLVAKLLTDGGYLAAVATYPQTLLSVSQSMLAVSVALVVVPFLVPVAWAWTLFVVFSVSQLSKARRSNSEPPPRWTWTGRGIGWWMASLVLRIVILSTTLYFGTLNAQLVSTQSATALYDTRPRDPFPLVDQLSTTISTITQYLASLAALGALTLLELGTGCYHLGATP